MTVSHLRLGLPKVIELCYLMQGRTDVGLGDAGHQLLSEIGRAENNEHSVISVQFLRDADKSLSSP